MSVWIEKSSLKVSHPRRKKWTNRTACFFDSERASELFVCLSVHTARRICSSSLLRRTKTLWVSRFLRGLSHFNAQICRALSFLSFIFSPFRFIWTEGKTKKKQKQNKKGRNNYILFVGRECLLFFYFILFYFNIKKIERQMKKF